MQIVVNISEEDYLSMKDGHIPFNMLDVVMSGTLLPKEHGRLGDLDKIFVKLNETQIEGTSEYKGLGEAKWIVCNAPTIVEADRRDEPSITPSYNSIKTELNSCEDCISRQAVEKITWEEPSYTDALNVLTEVREKVRALPPATPQPKIGHWNRVTQVGHLVWECDKCKWQQRFYTNYCSNCGAKMTESEL